MFACSEAPSKSKNNKKIRTSREWIQIDRKQHRESLQSRARGSTRLALFWRRANERAHIVESLLATPSRVWTERHSYFALMEWIPYRWLSSVECDLASERASKPASRTFRLFISIRFRFCVSQKNNTARETTNKQTKDRTHSALAFCTLSNRFCFDDVFYYLSINFAVVFRGLWNTKIFIFSPFVIHWCAVVVIVVVYSKYFVNIYNIGRT